MDQEIQLEELIAELSDRFESLMSKILRTKYDRLTQGEESIGTQTLAQNVRLRIVTAVRNGLEINDREHLICVAAKNARWTLLDVARRRDRAQKKREKVIREGGDRSETAKKYWLLVDEFLERMPVNKHRALAFAIQDAVEAMPDHLRNVFDLRFFYTNAEVAEQLELTVGQSRGRWDMAIKSMRRFLEQQFDSQE